MNYYRMPPFDKFLLVYCQYSVLLLYSSMVFRKDIHIWKWTKARFLKNYNLFNFWVMIKLNKSLFDCYVSILSRLKKNVFIWQRPKCIKNQLCDVIKNEGLSISFYGFSYPLLLSSFSFYYVTWIIFDTILTQFWLCPN